MIDYRCYLLDGVGAIRSVEIVACADDGRALAAARKLLRERQVFHGFELWQRDRRVHTEVRAPA